MRPDCPGPRPDLSWVRRREPRTGRFATTARSARQVDRFAVGRPRSGGYSPSASRPCWACSTHLLVMRRLRDASRARAARVDAGPVLFLHRYRLSDLGFDSDPVRSPLPETIYKPFGKDSAITADRLCIIVIVIVVTAVLSGNSAGRASAPRPRRWPKNPLASAPVARPDRGGELGARRRARGVRRRPDRADFVPERRRARLHRAARPSRRSRGVLIVLGDTRRRVRRRRRRVTPRQRHRPSGPVQAAHRSRRPLFGEFTASVGVGAGGVLDHRDRAGDRRDRVLPLRHEILDRTAGPRLGGSIRWPAVVVAFLATAAVALTVPDDWVTASIVSMATAIICLSIVLVTGYVGQVSLAQVAVAGFGAWISGRLAADHGLPFLLVALIAVAAAIPFGAVLAPRLLRTRGVSLAVLTLGVSVDGVRARVQQRARSSAGFPGTHVSRRPSSDGRSTRRSILAATRWWFSLRSTVAALVVGEHPPGSDRPAPHRGPRQNGRPPRLGIDVAGAKLVRVRPRGRGSPPSAARCWRSDSATINYVGSPRSSRSPSSSTPSSEVWGSCSACSSRRRSLRVGSAQTFDALRLRQQRAEPVPGRTVSSSHSWRTRTASCTPPPMGPADCLAVCRGAYAGTFDAVRPWSTDRRRAWRGRLTGTLAIDNLTVRFGGVVAVNNVSFVVEPGEVVGGAHRSERRRKDDDHRCRHRLRHRRGRACSIRLDGADLRGAHTARGACEGVGRSFQFAGELFVRPHMTVVDNLLAVSDTVHERYNATDSWRVRHVPRSSVVTCGTSSSAFEVSSRTLRRSR